MGEQIIKKEKPGYKICPECGERVKAQGYGGHLFLKHDIKIGMTNKLNELQNRLDELENKNGNPDSFIIKNNADGILILENKKAYRVPNELFKKLKSKTIEEERSVQELITTLVKIYGEQGDSDNE